MTWWKTRWANSRSLWFLPKVLVKPHSVWFRITDQFVLIRWRYYYIFKFPWCCWYWVFWAVIYENRHYTIHIFVTWLYSICCSGNNFSSTSKSLQKYYVNLYNKLGMRHAPYNQAIIYYHNTTYSLVSCNFFENSPNLHSRHLQRITTEWEDLFWDLFRYMRWRMLNIILSWFKGSTQQLLYW